MILPERLYEYYSSVRQRKVEWLWYPYIPYGKLTVLQGDPGEGKSTFIINVAALLTNGLPMPDGFGASGPQSVIYQCAEDNLADTIKPRLVQAKADCKRVAYIVDEDSRLTLEDDRIEQTLKETQARLFVVDPIQAFMPQDGDMQSAMRVRSVLGRLAMLADTYQCAVVLVGHMNKSNGGKNLYRGLGSIDIAAIARSVLMITRDLEQPQTRYMLPVKSSLSPEGSAIAFRFDSDMGFQWVGECTLDCNQLAKEAFDSRTKIELARKYLIEQLSERDMPSKVILAKLSELGICERTVNKMKKELHILSNKKGHEWFWNLPVIQESNASEDDVDE